MLVTAPYAIGAGDRDADGLAEAHADAVLKYLNLVSDTARFSSVSLWSGMLPRPRTTVASAPPGEEVAAEAAGMEGGGEGGTGGLDALC